MFDSEAPTLDVNIATLKDKLGMPLEQVPLLLSTVRDGWGKQSVTLKRKKGMFVTNALVWFLFGNRLKTGINTAFQLRDEERVQILSFFGPILTDPPGRHPTLDLLRTPGACIIPKITDAGLQEHIAYLWDQRQEITPGNAHRFKPEAVNDVLVLLDEGVFRVATPDTSTPSGWHTNEWLKQAILLSFRMYGNVVMDDGHISYHDKIPLKTRGWKVKEFQEASFRLVPPGTVRFGAYIGPNAVIMPSYVNIGAYVDAGTMVDTWATVGSCAQIGKDVHLSGGVGIGGVLEPPQASPTIIEDNCFIGARSEVVEGVIVRKRAVLSMGVFIGKNTPIVDRVNGGKVLRGEVPEGAVVMMGVHPTNGLLCPQIVKYRDEQTDAATALNEMLRGAV